MARKENEKIKIDHGAKRRLFDAFSEIARALSSGRRVEIIDILAQGERSVEEIAQEIDQSVANTSHHLQVLGRAGLVNSRREGTFIYYRLAGSEVELLWSSLRKVAEIVKPDLDRLAASYLGDTEDVEMLSREQLLEKMSRNEVLVLDARPSYEYHAGHLPGAWSIPLEELESYLGELPKTVSVVAYCRGPYCVFAPEAVRRLTEAGLVAMRLEDGFPEWKLAGFPVVEGIDPGSL